MKFILFVEGETEKKVLPSFLKRWLDRRLSSPVGIKAVKFKGWSELVENVEKRARLYLEGPNNSEIIAIISLLDLYGPSIYPKEALKAKDRFQWGKEYLEKKVSSSKFYHFFAVHEIEAWLFSDASIFSPQIGKLLPKKNPERINFDKPPKLVLNRIYEKAERKNYKEVTYGNELFARLDPEIVYEKCESFRLLVDKMLSTAKEIGL